VKYFELLRIHELDITFLKNYIHSLICFHC